MVCFITVPDCDVTLYLKTLDLYLSPFLISLLIFHSYNSSFGLLTIFQGGFMPNVDDFTYGIFVVWVPCLDSLSFWLHNVFSEIGKKRWKVCWVGYLRSQYSGHSHSIWAFSGSAPLQDGPCPRTHLNGCGGGEWTAHGTNSGVPQIMSLSCASKTSSQCLASTT